MDRALPYVCAVAYHWPPHKLHAGCVPCGMDTAGLIDLPDGASAMVTAQSAVQHAIAVESRGKILEREKAQILKDATEMGVQLVIGEQPSARKSVRAFDDLMEYARCVSELAAMDSMTSSAGPQFAALNGALGRDLIARLHSNESREKLVRKLERLERKLHLLERWTQDCADYKVRTGT